MWSVTKWLIVLNVLIFIAGLFWVNNDYGRELSIPFLYGYYSVEAVQDWGQHWRLITYQFIHANVGHLAFNMIALYFFGNMMERVMGKGRYLLFYLLCGVSGALFSSLLASFGLFDTGESLSLWRQIPMVGASGSIYGILMAGAFVFPKIKVQLLFPPVVLTMRTLALALLGLGIAYIAFKWDNAGGEAGHIGGMLMGGVLILMPFFRGVHAKRRHETASREVDRILEKISSQGMNSLTEEERLFIEKVSRQGRDG